MREHVLDAADHVGDLLERCPDLTVLATSRVPLDLYGEHCFPLGPLPAADALDLLVERAVAVDPTLELERGDVAAAVAGYLEAATAFLALDADIHAVARAAGVANALAAAGSAPVDAAAAGICGLVGAWSEYLGAPLHPMAALPHATARATLEARLGDRFEALAAEGASAPLGLDAVRVLAATALSSPPLHQA